MTKSKNQKSKKLTSNYPRHTLEDALRIPKTIFDQNAGKITAEDKTATFFGLTKSTGNFRLEISSSTKYGLIERPEARMLKPTKLAKQILRPQNENENLEGLRAAILNAPVFSDVYKHYRGENLPDEQFFHNALVDTFKVPVDKVKDFSKIFINSLEYAKLIERHDNKIKLLDISVHSGVQVDTKGEIKKLSKKASVKSTDECFVMMPFANPIGGYYESVFKPAIEKAGLTPIRADNDIFGTGKIIDQIWKGINNARVLIAELTSRNPNVYYELGMAHALKKPVVLISSNEEDVPFDLQHVRVIYYDFKDPFWGEKLINKIAENILSALDSPEEAILFK